MINYNNITESLKYYNNYNFNQIDVPWKVTSEVLNCTGGGKSNIMIKDSDKGLIASGEQGFIYMILKGQLPKGWYQSVTPCFRNDPQDFSHRKEFIKNELIITSDVGKVTLKALTEISLTFFNQFFTEPCICVKTEEGYDIEFMGIELGSYGMRKFNGHEWLYGTGCAEPRLSYAIKNNI